jgi:hypothetical protein
MDWFFWFRIKSNGSTLWTWEWTFRYHMRQQISWLAKWLLSSQERLLHVSRTCIVWLGRYDWLYMSHWSQKIWHKAIQCTVHTNNKLTILVCRGIVQCFPSSHMGLPFHWAVIRWWHHWIQSCRCVFKAFPTLETLLKRNSSHIHWTLSPKFKSFTLKIETAGSSETLVPTYQTSWLHMSEDCNIHNHCHEDLRSYFPLLFINTFQR